MSVELAPLFRGSSTTSTTLETDRSPSSASSSEALQTRGFANREVVGFLVVLLLGTTAWMMTTWSKSVNLADGESPPTMAFCGNSMLYYNDCPRLVEILLARLYNTSTSLRLQDSCLRGGSNLASLWVDGNGMDTRFGTSPAAVNHDIGAPTVESLLQNPPLASWNFVILEDHEQYSTLATARETSIQALRESYLPAIISMQHKQQPPTTILLLQTFAYKSPKLRETLDLPGFDEFTDALVEGYDAYANLVRDEFGLACQIIPMATAVQELMESDLWTLLYNWDDVHPSPHATWLQACLIVAVATGRAPPAWDETIQSTWEKRARHWQSTNRQHEQLLPLPTVEEADILRQLACRLVLSRNDQEDACA